MTYNNFEKFIKKTHPKAVIYEYTEVDGLLTAPEEDEYYELCDLVPTSVKSDGTLYNGGDLEDLIVDNGSVLCCVMTSAFEAPRPVTKLPFEPEFIYSEYVYGWRPLKKKEMAAVAKLDAIHKDVLSRKPEREAARKVSEVERLNLRLREYGYKAVPIQ